MGKHPKFDPQFRILPLRSDASFFFSVAVTVCMVEGPVKLASVTVHAHSSVLFILLHCRSRAAP